MDKSSQAILPFFAVQLISMMIFIIVLLTMLTMTKQVTFTVNEFDEKTAFLLASRRLVSSADCFAAEESSTLYDPTSDTMYFGSRVFPNVLDFSKLTDFAHFNCMREDLPYDRQTDVESGFWDAANATGGVFKYNIRVIDLTTGLDVYNVQSSGNYSTSLVGRITKNESFYPINVGTWSNTDACSDRFGGSSISDCSDQNKFCDNDSSSCMEGRCSASGEDRCKSDKDKSVVIPYWNTTSYGTQCMYNFTQTMVTSFDNTTNWSDVVWTQWDTTCEASNGSKSMIMPAMIKVGNALHPGVVYIDACLVMGQKYAGRNMLEAEYNPTPGGGGCCGKAGQACCAEDPKCSSGLSCGSDGVCN